MAVAIDTARKGVIGDFAGAPLQPDKEARPRTSGQFELYWPTGLLLDNDRAGSDFCSPHHVADLDFDEVAPAQLAVDRQVKQRSVSKPSLALKKETDCPNLLLRKGPLGADHFPSVPCWARLHGRRRKSHERTAHLFLEMAALYEEAGLVFDETFEFHIMQNDLPMLWDDRSPP